MLTLGIESSCDDTAAAVLLDDKELLSNIVSSQHEIHSRFGGVVPELASRKHLESVAPIVSEALLQANKKLSDIDLIAVTQGPGLIGSLLVGFCYAKALSFVSGIPYIGVDHMSGHLLSIFLEKRTPIFPYISLIVSGGTTSIFLCTGVNQYQLLGRTRDDAAGEAFDKVAKLLELGYPGGPIVAQRAASGNPNAYSFPRAWLEKESFDFSFSGVKTAVLNKFTMLKKEGHLPIDDICASFQQAVVEILVAKTIDAARTYNINSIVLGGGVSANTQLRQTMSEKCQQYSLELFTPQPVFCTDNAAMIAMSGYMNFSKVQTTAPDYEDDVFSRSLLG